jgi:ABC-2 type transport system permease protein
VPLGPVFQAEYRLLLRSVATRGRLLAVGALAVISILAAVVVALAGPDNPTRTAVGFVDGSLSTLVPVAVLVFGAATLGDLVDDGSLVYLWLRPVPTWCHVAAAWAATVTIAVPLVGVPTLVAAALIDTGSGLVVGATAAIVVAITCYAALFVAAGIVIRRALPWGLAYILIWEGFVASAGETASRLAIRSYVRSILSDRTGITLSLGDFTLASAVVVPLVVTAGALALATRRLARSDVA